MALISTGVVILVIAAAAFFLFPKISWEYNGMSETEVLTTKRIRLSEAKIQDLERRSIMGDTDATLALGINEYFAVENPDRKKGIHLIEAAARKGNLDAVTHIALIYARDQKNTQLAKEWLEKGLNSDAAKNDPIVAKGFRGMLDRLKRDNHL